MGHKNKKTLIRQVQETLDSKLAIGQSKHAAKINGSYRDHIYSWETYRTYLRQCCLFVRWCKDCYGCKDLAACRPHVHEWMNGRMAAGLSKYTLKTDLAALAKLFDEYPDPGKHPFGIDVGTRARSGIKRSRNAAARDKHFSETNNADLVTFCKCTGLRRSELMQIRGIDVDGLSAAVYRATKGGRIRIAPITGSPEEVATVQRLAAEAGSRKIFPKISSAADVHGYRAEYCARVYGQHARPIDQIPPADRYVCRGDKRGIIYDKKAMAIASQALGHSRIEVIASHYLLKEFNSSNFKNDEE